MLTKELEKHLSELRAQGRRLTRFDSLAKTHGMTEDEAKAVLNAFREKYGERVRGEPVVKESLTTEAVKPEKIPVFEWLVIKFAHQLQYVGFFIATVVDVALAWFFFYSLGSGDLGKMVLGALGIVLTAAKLWGWAYSKIDRKALPLALFTVALSLFGNTAILRAEFELQAKSVLSSNTEQSAKESPVDVISGQIAEKKAELEKKVAARDVIDPSVESNLPMYRTLDNMAKAANKELKELTERLEAAQAVPVVAVVETVKESEMKLDAWSVFRQWTELDLDDKPRSLAYFFTLIFAFLPELVIYATTPRKAIFVGRQENKE